ncbi:MAG: VanZ family protein [Burkholderiaceae bacterium]
MIKSIFWLSLLGIFVLSLLPGEQLPQQAGLIWDKAQHAIGFVWLGLWGLAAFPARPWRVLAGLLLFGMGIELSQALTSWREGDMQDWMADAVGLAVASAVAQVWRRLQASSTA